MTRKFTFLLMALLALAGFKSWGQETITVDFESGIPSGWTLIDNDNDGRNWYVSSEYDITNYSTTKCLRSDSYDMNTWASISADNLFVSPQITLGEGAKLSFYSRCYATYDADKIIVGISETGNVNDFVSLYSQQQTQNWTKIDVDLNAYAGQSVHVVFRHTDTYHYFILIDDITIDLGLLGTQYNIAYDNANIEHGSISGPATAYSGQPVKVTATPDAGYALDHITVNGVDYEGTTFTMPENDATVSATFRQTVPFTVNDGTDVYDKAPFYGDNAYYNYTKSQFVIPASYIENMQGCKIAQLKFYVNSSSSYNPDWSSDSWDVYVKEMDDPSGAWWNFYDFGTMTKVYSGSVSIVNNELTITFDEPFPYNDKSLMIGFNQTSNGFYGETHWLGSNNTSGSAGGSRCRAGWQSGNQYETKPFLPKTTFAYIPSTTYTVTVNQPEEGGSISAEPTADVAAGTTVTLSATPATGYEFGEWTVINFTTSQEITVTDNQFEMPESNVTVTATFEALVPHTVTIADGIQHGTVSLFPDAPHEYMAGETVYLDVTADDGYFYPREGEITVTDANGNNIDVFINGTEYNFIMPNSNVTVWAVFNMYYGVQVDTEIVGGYISVTSDFEHYPTLPFFTAGTSVYFIPTPGDDYEYDYEEHPIYVYEWDPEQEVIGNPVSVDFNSGFAHITMPTSHIFVTATFNRTKYNVTQQIVSPSESGYFYIENTEHIAVGAPVVISDITPIYDYQFVSVTVTRNDDQTTVDTHKYNDDYIFNMPDSDVTVTVNFKAIPYYDVTINEPENGSAYINGAQRYHAGDEVVLTANPDEGYIISATDITITPAEGEPFHPTYVEYTSYVFNMPASDVTITAAFREIQTYTINYYVNGELEGTASCKENEAIDIYTYTPYVYGVNFEGWGVAPIGTYDTEKPTIIGEEEYPTHNYDLHAVFSYSEMAVANAWTKVIDFSELNDNDVVIIGAVQNGNSGYTLNEISVMQSSATCPALPATFSNDGTTITELPEGTTHFTVTKYPYNDGAIYLKGESGKNLSSFWGYNLNIPAGWEEIVGDDYNDIINFDNGKLQIAHNDNWDELYVILHEYGQYGIRFGVEQIAPDIFYAAYLYKQQITLTNYYMTEVFVIDEATSLTEDMTKRNVIIADGASLNINANVTLNVAGACFNPSHDATKFVVAEGGQLVHHNEGTVATFEKNITGYTNAQGNDGYYLIANPTDNTTVANLTSNNYDLYTFDGAADLEWINMKSSPVVANDGIGYLYANSSNVTLGFAGEIIPAGSTDINLNYANKEFGGFNLLGNPYACNAYVGKSFYVIQGTELTLSENAYVAPCEGFFVEAAEDDLSVTLSTTVPAPTSLLSLTVSQNRGNVIDRAIVRFDGANDLHKFMLNPDHTNIRLAKNGEEFAAISSEAEGEIPVSFKAEKNGSYTITVNTENVNAHYIHLIDNKTGMDVDLLATPSYTFNASTSDYAYRFKLVFSMTGVEENGSNANSYAYINNGNLVIDHIEGEATMQIVDMLGRVVSTEIVSGSYNKALNLKAGLYIINLNGMTQKIVVK